MRTTAVILAFVSFVLVLGTGETLAAAIQIQNAGVESFQYSVRHEGESAWSQAFSLAPGQTRALSATRPVVISYWTDKPRFMTLQPGRAYRIQDVRRGELKQVTVVLRPSPTSDSPVPAPPPKTAAGHPETLGSAAAPKTGPRVAAAVRIVRVRALADATYRRVVDDWNQRIRLIVTAASDYFEANFQIRFDLVGIQPWEYRGVARHPESRLKALLAVPPEEADLLIGFIGFGEYYTSGEITYITGLLGMGMPFGQHVMVSGSDHFHLNRDKVVLIHELAHVFGAFHVDNRRSLMYPMHSGVPTEILTEGKFELEPPLREVVMAARNLDFQRGVDSLDPAARRRIQTLARQYRLPREARAPTPIAMARVVQELRENAQGNQGRPSGTAGDLSQATLKQEEVFGQGEKVRVTAEATPLRAGEATLASLPFGETLEVVLQQDPWVRVIARERGVRGWVPLKSLFEGSDAGRPQIGQQLLTSDELDVTVDNHLLATLPPGIQVGVVGLELDRVELQAERFDVATFKGGKLVFEPVVEGWVLREHVARSSTADLTD
ncbi:MAG: hypothetical protein MUE50_10265 [Pirellulaceae bacterium]|jgi:hypothetical protein|nr:hypothetical protein [Pirellulaceae bacterium]